MDLIRDLEKLDDIASELDYDYSVGERYIDDMEQFRQELLGPFTAPDRNIFYRGERIVSLKRPLLPTLFRDRSLLMGEGEFYADIDSDHLLEFYRSYGRFFELFCSAFGEARKYCIYDLCAFSQHYLECSPFIDFTKSLYVALSFGLKGKKEFADDGMLYTVEISDPANYTKDRVTAECWLNDYHVRVYNSGSGKAKLGNDARTSPDAKIIDIATNDRMKFQQGVFLLLDNFTLVNRLYLTKSVRDSVRITKYILSKKLCPELTELVEKSAPWYSFSNLLDVSAGIQAAIDCRQPEL